MQDKRNVFRDLLKILINLFGVVMCVTLYLVALFAVLAIAIFLVRLIGILWLQTA